jgi:2-oxo-4-hydroxy-4-carboxy-5-ureidoimidazoline decarboxylase
MENQKLTIANVNEMTQEDFSALLGPFFDATPAIVERSYAENPFNSLEEIYFSLCAASLDSPPDEKMRLLRNYPDFVLELQVEGTGETSSVASLTGEGMSNLTSEEYSRIFHLNGAYRGVYGIPFILYLPEHNSVESIFENFALRLQNRREEELDVALEEAMKFAWLRLNLFVENR